MQLHYSGNLCGELPGRLLGPDNYGGMVVVEYATYDLATHLTTAHCRPALGHEAARSDEFGQLWLVREPEEVSA